MSGGNDGVGVDQDTTAEVAALVGVLQTDNVGELAERGGGSSHDVSATGLDGGSQGESGQHES